MENGFPRLHCQDRRSNGTNHVHSMLPAGDQFLRPHTKIECAPRSRAVLADLKSVGAERHAGTSGSQTSETIVLSANTLKHQTENTGGPLFLTGPSCVCSYTDYLVL